MASAMDCETLAIKRDMVLKKDDDGEEMNGELELSLDLSLGGSIGKSKQKRKDDPCLKKYPSGNLQPCLKKFASGSFDKYGEECRDKSCAGIEIDSGKTEIWKNLHGNKPSCVATSGTPPLSRSQSGVVTFDEARSFVLPNGSGVKATWPNQFVSSNTSTPTTMVQIGTGHPKILRTCSVGALGAAFMTPQPTSVLQRQPSVDVLLPDRKQEGVQSTTQKEVLEQQRKREMHALRRQEARRKREEKKARRDEGKSLENKVSVSFPISSNAIPCNNKWMLNPEPSSTTQTNHTQMDTKEGKLKTKSKPLLETQRSLKRDRERAARENEPWIESEKRVKRKGIRNGSMDLLPCDFDLGSKLGVPDPTETSKFTDKKANGNHSACIRTGNSPMKGHSTRKTDSPARGNSGSEEKNSKDLSENGHKSSSSNAEEGESAFARSRSQSTNSEASASGPYTTPAFSVLPIPYPFPVTGANGQCMPLPIGFSFPYMMPYWTPATQPTGTEISKCNTSHAPNVIQPVSAHGLPPSEMPIQGTLRSWLSVPQAMGAPVSVQNSHACRGSFRKSSSTIPDQDGKSSQGTSSDETKSQSSKSGDPTAKGVQSLARFPSVNMAQGHILSASEVSASHKPEPAQIRDVVEKTPCTSAQSEFEIPSSKTSQEKPIESPSKKSSRFVSDSNEKKQISSSHGVPEQNSGGQTKQTAQNLTNGKPDQDGKSNLKAGRSCSQSGNGLLQTLHRVTTTGVGPKGITISGILSYSSNQVRIVCGCHDTEMSPAEFVQHAGSTDISNPERNIVVTPMLVTIPVTSAQG